MSEGPYTSSYVGIVITNEPDSDDHLYQVQVYVEGVDIPVPALNRDGYIFPGEGSMNVQVLPFLRQCASWYSIDQPIVGGGSSGHLYENAKSKYNGLTYVSDGIIDAGSASIPVYGWTGKFSPGLKNISVNQKSRIDFQSNPTSNLLRHGNFTGNTYTDMEYYPNAPKGRYSIPDIGACVRVAYTRGQKALGHITGSAQPTRNLALILNYL